MPLSEAQEPQSRAGLLRGWHSCTGRGASVPPPCPGGSSGAKQALWSWIGHSGPLCSIQQWDRRDSGRTGCARHPWLVWVTPCPLFLAVMSRCSVTVLGGRGGRGGGARRNLQSLEPAQPVQCAVNHPLLLPRARRGCHRGDTVFAMAAWGRGASLGQGCFPGTGMLSWNRDVSPAFLGQGCFPGTGMFPLLFWDRDAFPAFLRQGCFPGTGMLSRDRDASPVFPVQGCFPSFPGMLPMPKVLPPALCKRWWPWACGL